MNFYTILLFLFLLIIPNGLSADVAWPALIYVFGIVNSWYSIIIGFFGELLILKFATKLSFRKVLILTFYMNLFAAILGIIFIPLIDLILQFPAYLIFGINVSNAIREHLNWVLVYLGILALIINVIIKSVVFFKMYPVFNKKYFIPIIIIANIFSVGVSMLFMK